MLVDKQHFIKDFCQNLGCFQDVTDSSDMTEIRTMTGVCPQENILVEELSVKEHLQVFGMIKGLTGSQLDAQV